MPAALPLRLPRSPFVGASVAAVALQLATVASVRAAEWIIEPWASSRIEHNSNYFLAPVNEQAVTTLVVSPGVRFATETEISSLSVAASVAGRKPYGFDAGFNDRFHVDGNLLFGARTRTERAQYAFDTRFVRDSTFATELAQTGAITQRVQRNLFQVLPGYRYALTERLNLLSDGGVTLARYEKTGTNGLADFNSYQLSGGLGYAWSERTTVSSVLGWTRFNTDPYTNRARTVYWNNIVEHRFSESLRGTASAGIARVRTEVREAFACVVNVFTGAGSVPTIFPNNFCFANGIALTVVRPSLEGSATARLFNLGLDWQFAPRSSFNAAARQDVNPSGLGTVVKTLGFSTALNHSFTEKLRGAMDVRYTDSTLLGGFTNALDSRNLNFGGLLAWQFTRELSLEGGARRTQVKFDNAAANASGNLVYGALRYDWPRMSVAR